MLEVFVIFGFSGLLAAGTLSAVQLLLVCMDSHLDFYICRTSIRVESALLTSIYKRLLHGQRASGAEVVLMKRYTDARGYSRTLPLPFSEEEKNNSVTPDSEAESKKGAIFNIVFVDVPSIAEMVMTSADLVVLPIRVGLAALLLAMQVPDRRRFLPVLLLLLSKTAIK